MPSLLETDEGDQKSSLEVSHLYGQRWSNVNICCMKPFILLALERRAIDGTTKRIAPKKCFLFRWLNNIELTLGQK